MQETPANLAVRIFCFRKLLRLCSYTENQRQYIIVRVYTAKTIFGVGVFIVPGGGTVFRENTVTTATAICNKS
jgi:hypothetical protein